MVQASASAEAAGSAENAAISISSKVCHGSGGLSGCASRPATCRSTSGIARVWWSGRIAGGASVATAIAAPDSGRPSIHDSRNE